MCDHSGRNFGRPSGWPQLVPIGPDGKLDPKVLSVSGYYDAVNFARKIKVPTVMGVGLIDNTCPCTTCFAAYSVLAGPKQMDIAPLMGHGTSPSYIALSSAWILKQAGLKK
jgi:cephalosporin-C deacetylase-like acetyl esterase